MLIDRSHRTWAVGSALTLLLGGVCYWLYANSEPTGPTGGSRPGLLFALVGSAMMVFAWLLAPRKRVRAMPLGSARFWMKGHLWLGALSLPFILFHTAFRWGGGLETALWVVFIVVYASGFIGLAIQQLVPRLMSSRLPTETFGDQIPFQQARTVFLTDKKIADETGVLDLHGTPLGEIYRKTTEFYAAADKDDRGNWIDIIPAESRTLYRNLASHSKDNGWVRTVDDFPALLPQVYAGLPEAPKRTAKRGAGASPLEKMRAQAKKTPPKQPASEEAGTEQPATGEAQPAKPLSPLERIRARQGAGESTTPSDRPAPADQTAPPPPRTIETPEKQRQGIRDFYLTDVRPYLTTANPGRHPLNNRRESGQLFARMRSVLSAPALRDELEQLEASCHERRQFALQQKLHRVLHAWLLLHVPASMALLVLFLVHIVMALRVVPF